MSEETVDRIERAKELVRIWNTGDLERYLANFAPDAVFNPDPSWPEQGPFTGEAIARFMRNYLEAWEHAEIALDAIEENGDVVLMRCRWILRGAGSGIELPTEFSIVVRIDDEGLVGAATRSSTTRRRAGSRPRPPRCGSQAASCSTIRASPRETAGPPLLKGPEDESPKGPSIWPNGRRV